MHSFERVDHGHFVEGRADVVEALALRHTEDYFANGALLGKPVVLEFDLVIRSKAPGAFPNTVPGLYSTVYYMSE